MVSFEVMNVCQCWCFTAKCIDQYVKLRVANADGNDEPVPMDSRLEGVVEKMFDRCIKDHQYKQVVHI